MKTEKTYVVGIEEEFTEVVKLSKEEHKSLSAKLNELQNRNLISDYTIDSTDEPMSFSDYQDKLSRFVNRLGKDIGEWK